MDNRKCLFVDLPSIEYRKAWDLQIQLVGARKDGIIDMDIVLILEHPPVFTLGRRGGLNNLMVSEDFLEKEGIPVIQVERGGDITFHGPGQLVIYPIIDMEKARLKVVDYMSDLEEVMIRAAGEWGITAERNDKNRGVWVGNRKLGSVGIAVRRGICFHGLALNINPSLNPFAWINPCGLQDIGMTSMEREITGEISMNEVREVAKRHMETVLGFEFQMTDLEEVQRLLQK